MAERKTFNCNKTSYTLDLHIANKGRAELLRPNNSDNFSSLNVSAALCYPPPFCIRRMLIMGARALHFIYGWNKIHLTLGLEKQTF